MWAGEHVAESQRNPRWTSATIWVALSGQIHIIQEQDTLQRSGSV